MAVDVLVEMSVVMPVVSTRVMIVMAASFQVKFLLLIVASGCTWNFMESHGI